MLLNSQNLFFQSPSQVAKKNESEVLAQSVTNIQKINAISDFKKPRLSATWHKENGKLVCKWIIN
ncbi:MAG: hypothetical protein HC862_13065 [Scytonema sp. RU_4_4]|nr:hypothetical protein [Scytonema sp. RU_4_4]NJR75519.1 hypothetical protein [Scytonema sp. CRU_2_7]